MHRNHSQLASNSSIPSVFRTALDSAAINASGPPFQRAIPPPQAQSTHRLVQPPTPRPRSLYLLPYLLSPAILILTVKMGGLLAQFLAAVVFVKAPSSPEIYVPLGILAFVMGIVEGALGVLRA